MTTRSRTPWLASTALLAAGITLAASTSSLGAADLDADHPEVRAVRAVQEEVTGDVMRWAGVLGTAIGLDEKGDAALIVLADQDNPGAVADVVRALPPTLRGKSVRVEMTGRVRAMAKKPPGGGGGGGTTFDPKLKQTLPISLGTSGGWQLDLANGYCCGGTLGSLLTANGVFYILSNYHVLEADIVAGGNGTVAASGTSVIQPGLIDAACTAANSSVVGSLITMSSLPGSNVDAAIAQVSPGAVKTDGSILGIGTLTSSPAAAVIGRGVKKTGRTTGLTRSSIFGLNATISVTYENECGGGTAFTKTFNGQILIKNRGSAFLNSGDSGSLMVEDVATAPRPVGLLYAGGSTVAVANPIGEVLTFISGKLGATTTVVGQ